MSNAQVSFAHSARRHVRDAKALVTNSPLQAYHLAGYGPECARKALPGLEAYAKVLGHTVDVDSTLTTIFSALDPTLHRYPVFKWPTRFPTLAKWEPQVRYAADTDARRSHATSMLEEATTAVVEVLAALYADGRVPEKAFR